MFSEPMDDSEMPLSELTFQSMIESIPNAIVLVNKEGKISYINNQTEKLFKYPRTELIGKSIEQLIPDRFRKNHPASSLLNSSMNSQLR